MSTTAAMAESTPSAGAPTRRRSQKKTQTPEKDDVELRLEKALFGDDAGFLDSLSAAKHSEGKALAIYGSDEGSDAASDGAEDLGDVPDEDVRMPSPSTPRQC